MNKMVDLGQCEGGIVQGIGWMTVEELINDTWRIGNINNTVKELKSLLAYSDCS